MTKRTRLLLDLLDEQREINEQQEATIAFLEQALRDKERRYIAADNEVWDLKFEARGLKKIIKTLQRDLSETLKELDEAKNEITRLKVKSLINDK